MRDERDLLQNSDVRRKRFRKFTHDNHLSAHLGRRAIIGGIKVEHNELIFIVEASRMKTKKPQ